MVNENRVYTFAGMAAGTGYWWTVETRIEPAIDKIVMGASRFGGYSGLTLRMGQSFADPYHCNSEGAEEDVNVMGQRARWVSATGATGGMVVMMDHPENPRHPVAWFAHKNYLEAGLLMEGDLEIEKGDCLHLRYGFGIFNDAVKRHEMEDIYGMYAG
jgi:hypothetical protein